MSEAPERIWAWDGETPYFWVEGEEDFPASGVPYIRADAHAAAVREAVEAERRKWAQVADEWVAQFDAAAEGCSESGRKTAFIGAGGAFESFADDLRKGDPTPPRTNRDPEGRE